MIAIQLRVPDSERQSRLKKLLCADPEIYIVPSGASPATLAGACNPEFSVVIVDLAHPEAGQACFWAELHVLHPQVRLVALTEASRDTTAVGVALQAGATYMVDWSEPPHRVRRAIWAAANGSAFIPLGPVLAAICAYFDSEARLTPPVERCELQLDLEHRQLLKSQRAIHLTALEFELLRYLTSRPGQVATLHEIASAVWRQPFRSARLTNQIKSTVNRLRRKLEDNPHEPKILLNAYGHGYYVSKSFDHFNGLVTDNPVTRLRPVLNAAPREKEYIHRN